MTPPRANAGFAARMEDVLEVYARPPDAARPLVCFDETGKDLKAHVRPPQNAAPGRPARQDNEYARNGSANLFLACAPHLGWREARVTDRRRAVDAAYALRDLVDAQFPAAACIVLVTDNLNVHTPAALYETFPAAEARRIAARIEWHYTPTHGSWLNMAEIELSVLARQCLNRRLGNRTIMEREVAAWVATRNSASNSIDWQFTTADARIKLKRLYPVVHA